MKILVNGKEKTVRAGSTLKTAVADEPYVKGTLVSVHLSEEKVIEATRDFEISTTRGTLVMHLNDTPEAEMWKSSLIQSMEGINARWVTHDLVAFGSFKTELEVDRDEYMYRMYDCFLSLGGFDNHTTYLMVAKDNHRGTYGAGHAVIGKITVGRHILSEMREGDSVISVKPLMSETNTENVIVTKDLSLKLEEGYRVETAVCIDLDEMSPEASEHVLILSSSGTITATDVTGSYVACSDDLDVKMPTEHSGVRDRGTVTIRNDGLGTGRMYMYKDRRQVSPLHTVAGQMTTGGAIVSHVSKGDQFTVVTNPPRALSVGMTQAEGEEFLESRGIKQVRVGDTSDDAIIAEQTPERTLTALSAGEVETLGVPRDRVFKIKLTDKDPEGTHYFRKITGLSHKPIGSMKVQFTFEGLPMVTFYGDEMKGKNLYPTQPFKKVSRGDIGLTNQARPHRGLIGIRLEASKDFGPTGEEAYGTNIIGKFDDDLDRMMDGLSEESIVYITEDEL